MRVEFRKCTGHIYIYIYTRHKDSLNARTILTAIVKWNLINNLDIKMRKSWILNIAHLSFSLVFSSFQKCMTIKDFMYMCTY